MPFGCLTKLKGRTPFTSLATLYAIFLLGLVCGILVILGVKNQ